MKAIKNIILMGLVVVLSACSSWTTIHEKSEFASDEIAYTSGSSISDRSAFLVSLDVTADGAKVNPSTDFSDRLIQDFEKSNIFKSFSMGRPNTADEDIQLLLNISENQDTHQGAAMVKGFFIGLTLFLLEPVLPLRYDFDSAMELKVIRWDGEEKVYSAQSSGTAKFHLFANPAMAGNDVRAKVTTNNINSLINQLKNDVEFVGQ